jgi:hypothetical protein
MNQSIYAAFIFGYYQSATILTNFMTIQVNFTI